MKHINYQVRLMNDQMKWYCLVLIAYKNSPLQVGHYSVANRTLVLNKHRLKFYRTLKDHHNITPSKCLESDSDVCKHCYQKPESGNV